MLINIEKEYIDADNYEEFYEEHKKVYIKFIYIITIFFFNSVIIIQINIIKCIYYTILNNKGNRRR